MIVAIVFLGIALVAIRRASKKGQLSYAYCQFCKQSVPAERLFGLRSHYKTVHNEYWRWSRNTGLIFFSGSVLIFASLFIALGLGFIPATANSPLTWNFFIGWASTFFGFGVLFGLYRLKTGRRFKGSAGLLHATPSRTYGNLGGIGVQLKFSQKRRGRLLSTLSFLDPLGVALEAFGRLVMRGTHGRYALDRFENGLLWYYTLGDLLASLELKPSTLTMVHEKRLKVEATGGAVEIETETVAELEKLRSIISGLAQAEPSFTTVAG